MAKREVILVFVDCSCGKHTQITIHTEELRADPEPRPKVKLPSAGVAPSVKVAVRLLEIEED